MKGQSLGEIYPKGICLICKQPTDSEAIAHYECSIAYTEEKLRLAREREAKFNKAHDKPNKEVLKVKDE